MIENLGTWESAKNYLIKNSWFPCLIFYEQQEIVERELLGKINKDEGLSLSDNDISIDRGNYDSSPKKENLDKSLNNRRQRRSTAAVNLFFKGEGEDLSKKTEDKLKEIFLKSPEHTNYGTERRLNIIDINLDGESSKLPELHNILNYDIDGEMKLISDKYIIEVKGNEENKKLIENNKTEESKYECFGCRII